MDTAYQSRLELFVNNHQQAKADFTWKNTMNRRLAAMLYTAENKVIDTGGIKDCEALIKESTGLFSTFRGNSALSVATLLSLTPDPRRCLENTLQVYDLMKDAGFRASDFLVVAACMIAMQSEPGRFTQTVGRAKAFYDAMKSEHWFLTGQDDYIFAALFGMSGIEVQAGADRVEYLFSELKLEFHPGNSVQALAMVLLLGGDTFDSKLKTFALNKAFRENGLKMDKEYTLSSLGVLSLLPQDADAIVRSVQETYEYIRTQPGFGAFSVSKQEALLLSAALFAFTSADQIKKGIMTSAISTTIASIIIAQQTAAMIAATTAASAAAASAATN